MGRCEKSHTAMLAGHLERLEADVHACPTRVLKDHPPTTPIWPLRT